ncbi:MAG: hypothetical protein KF777_15355 [Planctomycetaceae bacterium]|nr:hypothetical protein [Planctomycetaceae bacterium]
MPPSREPSPSGTPSWLFVAAAAWVIGFSLWFSSFDLPNNRPLTRADIWSTVPFHLMDLVDPPPAGPDAPPSGLRFLPQRVLPWSVAAAVLLSAFGYGRLLLKSLRLQEFDLPTRLFLGTSLGLAVLATFTLAFGFVGVLNAPFFWIIVLSGVGGGLVLERGHLLTVPSWPDRSFWWCLALASPFLVTILLGSVTPQNDFDVRAYHLEGPKEFFLQGKVRFLSHNVYTSFPFLTEMLTLLGMVLCRDWFAGSLAGQAVLAAFAPLTAIGLFAAGRRWYSPTAGRVAALVFLSTPWTTRISIIAYAEGGLSLFVFASAFAACLAIDPKTPPNCRKSVVLMTGLFAGAAMACKYPGLVSAVVPAAVVLGLSTLLSDRGADDLAGGRGKRISQTAGLFAIGLACTIGPWLLKNLLETGNPVYPLAYSIFGGTDLTPELAEKWNRGHSPPHYKSLANFIVDFGRKLADVLGNNDWHSALLYTFAPLVVFQAAGRTFSRVIAAWLFWMFLAWFLLTHHIDRFWVPMIPLAALLAGAGATWSASRRSLAFVATVGVAWGAFNLTLVTSSLAGYNVWLTDLNAARQAVVRADNPEIALLNEALASGRLQEPILVLCVGDAGVFHANFPVLYNSVFDQPLLERLSSVPGSESPENWPTQATAEALVKLGVTHILVNWREILRYREPGSYGYSDSIHPDLFRRFQEAGLLGPSLPEFEQHSPLSSDLKSRLEAWAPTLIDRGTDPPTYLSGQVFKVIPSNRLP